MKYIIISDKWAQDEVECTMSDLQEQADIYTRENAARLDPMPPVTIETAIRNGCDVIIDETGETVAVSVDDRDAYFA